MPETEPDPTDADPPPPLHDRVEARGTIGAVSWVEPVDTTAAEGPAVPADRRGEPRAPVAVPPPGPPPRARVGRRILQVGAVLFALLVGYYLVSLYQVWSTGRQDHTGPVDAIVVLGAAQYDGRPSPQLAARLDHVVDIWPEGRAPMIVATGGNLPGDRFTEAEASARYLVAAGIPESTILVVGEGADTYESLAAVAEALGDRGADSVLLVTDPYHALRSRLIAEELGLDAHVSSTDTSVVTGAASTRRHLQEAAGVALGRIIGFDRLADLAG